MSRSKASAGQQQPRGVLVLDNGGGSIKLGLAGQDSPARCATLSCASRLPPGTPRWCTGARARLVQGIHQHGRQGQGRAQSNLGPRAGGPTGRVQSHAPAPRRQASACTAQAGRAHLMPRAAGQSCDRVTSQESCCLLSCGMRRGYVVNWDLQRQIWEHALKALLAAQGTPDLRSSVLLVTEPMFNFPACREGCQQVPPCI